MKKGQDLPVNFFTDDSTEAGDKTKTILKKLMEFIVEADFEKVDELYDLTKCIKYSGQAYIESIENYDEEKQLLFHVGYAYSLIDVMQSYIEKRHVEREILKIKTGYRDKVLYVLAKRGAMFHKDLAFELGVSPSGLNAIMKQMRAVSEKLINVDDISKFKIYSLTPVAYQYVTKNNINDYRTKRKQREVPIQITYRMTDTEAENELRNSPEYYIDIGNDEKMTIKEVAFQFYDSLRQTNKNPIDMKSGANIIHMEDRTKKMAVS